MIFLYKVVTELDEYCLEDNLALSIKMREVLVPFDPESPSIHIAATLLQKRNVKELKFHK